jgi:hypothetical protein
MQYVIDKKKVIKNEYAEAIKQQKEKTLSRIYERLRDSTSKLESKNNEYNEIEFEIDIKNIIQALVPKAVRLGSESSGSSVPDGYCTFYKDDKKRKYVFGWDAKYSEKAKYSLSKKDYKKQLKYMNWLNTDSEVKNNGKLFIYSIISNSKDINRIRNVLSRLARAKEKPRNCKVIYIQDEILINIGKWLLNNYQEVIKRGPEISKIIFKWIRSDDRNKYGKLIYISKDDWDSIEKILIGSIK